MLQGEDLRASGENAVNSDGFWVLAAGVVAEAAIFFGGQYRRNCVRPATHELGKWEDPFMPLHRRALLPIEKCDGRGMSPTTSVKLNQ